LSKSPLEFLDAGMFHWFLTWRGAIGEIHEHGLLLFDAASDFFLSPRRGPAGWCSKAGPKDRDNQIAGMVQAKLFHLVLRDKRACRARNLLLKAKPQVSQKACLMRKKDVGVVAGGR
jgi:hypothetical protein